MTTPRKRRFKQGSPAWLAKQQELMANARVKKAEKPSGGFRRFTDEERDGQVDRALELLTQKHPQGINTTLMKEFGVCQKTAAKRLARAKLLIKQQYGAKREDQIAKVQHELQSMIQANSEKAALRLSAIKAKIELLGLAEPTKTEATITGDIRRTDPIDVYTRNPEVLAQAIGVEARIHDLATEHTRPACPAKVDVSPPHPRAGNGQPRGTV